MPRVVADGDQVRNLKYNHPVLDARPRRVLLGRLAAVAVLFAVGVPSKWYEGPGERYVVAHVWDVCGSAIVLLAGRLLWPRARPHVNALVVGVLLLGNELLQLVHAPWLETLRATLFGRVVLGSHFNPLDLVAIAASVGLAAFLDAVPLRRRGTRACASRRTP